MGILFLILSFMPWLLRAKFVLPYLDVVAGDMYLGAIVAQDHPEQAPEHMYAKWYDLLPLLLLPMVGFIFFTEIPRARYREHQLRRNK